MTTATIIICTKDREADLARCLDSLLTQTRMPEEVLVVDSGSDNAEQCVRDFAKRAQDCRVQYLRSEPGLTRQRNLGIGEATQDVIHFLDDDVILDEHYVEEIQRVYEEPANEDVLGVGPVLDLPRSVSRLSGVFRRLFLLTHIDGDGRMQQSGFAALSWLGPFEDVHPIEVGCGCCTFRRDLFVRMSFDEWFEGYGYMEDVDFTYRVSRTGRLIENPRARMLHVESPSDRLDYFRLTKMQIVNHYYVFRKHLPQDFFHRLCFWWSELGESLRRLARFARTGDWDIIRGMASGYATILSGAASVQKTERNGT